MQENICKYYLWVNVNVNVNEGLMSKIYKEVIKLNRKEPKTLIKKSNRLFFHRWPTGPWKVLNITKYEGNANQNNKISE